VCKLTPPEQLSCVGAMFQPIQVHQPNHCVCSGGQGSSCNGHDHHWCWLVTRTLCADDAVAAGALPYKCFLDHVLRIMSTELGNLMQCHLCDRPHVIQSGVCHVSQHNMVAYVLLFGVGLLGWVGLECEAGNGSADCAEFPCSVWLVQVRSK
jgi:hypothetical protein